MCTDTLNQVARDQELLDTTRDYLYFITKFFEPINLSAPHIYHSALELSPLSSIVQENYHPSQDLKPRVIYGLPSSWDHPVTIHGDHGSYTWSPCGQFIAVLGITSVDIWDSLTLEKHSSLQLTGPGGDLADYPQNLLAYSPDGHSLAGYDCFSSKITIWDVQTGGGVGDVVDGAASHPPHSLVWSSDGTMIGVVYQVAHETWDVHTHHIASGESVPICKIPSVSAPFLWSHNGPFQVMTILHEDNRAIVNIFKVGPALLDNLTKSFPINLDVRGSNKISFSPATCCQGHRPVRDDT